MPSNVVLVWKDMCFWTGNAAAAGFCRMDDAERFSGRLTLRMPKTLHRELFDTAIAQRVSMNQLICVALAGALERMRVEHARPRR